MSIRKLRQAALTLVFFAIIFALIGAKEPCWSCFTSAMTLGWMAFAQEKSK